ncbi:MAG: FtsX-like permease family protein, partial [Clostridia bacterium]|nr:FtsX-like permease family protein [Clostridia bacterium]
MIVAKIVTANIKSKKIYAVASTLCITLAACVISACCGFFFSVFTANDAQSRKVFVFLVLLVSFLAVFIIRSIFTVNLGERTKTLGLLISLGMTRFKASLALLIENLCYGVIGTALGVFLGRGFAEFYVSFYDSQMQIYLFNLYGKYYGSDIAIRRVEFNSSATVVILTIAICLFAVLSATVTPMLRAYKTSPVESSKGTERINISERE